MNEFEKFAKEEAEKDTRLLVYDLQCQESQIKDDIKQLDENIKRHIFSHNGNLYIGDLFSMFEDNRKARRELEDIKEIYRIMGVEKPAD